MNDFLRRDCYTPKLAHEPMVLGNLIKPIPFTDNDLKTFDKVLGNRRTAQKTKMRKVFESCDMTESSFTRSGKKKSAALTKRGDSDAR